MRIFPFWWLVGRPGFWWPVNPWQPPRPPIGRPPQGRPPFPGNPGRPPRPPMRPY